MIPYQRRFVTFVLITLFIAPNLWAESQTTNETIGPDITASLQVKASDYALFLNAVAATDPYALHNEKMSCIERSGAPGYYTYAVLAGEEEKAMSFMSQLNADWYCNWLENTTSLFDSLYSEIHHFSYSGDFEISASTSTFNFTCCRTAFKKNGDEEDASWKLLLAGIALLSSNKIEPNAENILRDQRSSSSARPSISSSNTEELDPSALSKISLLIKQNNAISHETLDALTKAEETAFDSPSFEKNWKHAEKSILETKKHWAETAGYFHSLHREALKTPLSSQEGDPWVKTLSWLAHQQKLWTAKLLQCRAQQNEGVAQMALKRAISAPSGTLESALAWGESLETSKTTMKLYQELVLRHETYKNQESSEKNNLYWYSEWNDAKNQNLRWHARVCWREANQKLDTAVAAEKKVITSQKEDRLRALAETLALYKKAEQALTETVVLYQENSRMALNKYQDDWLEALAKAENQKKKCSALTLKTAECQMNEEETVMARASAIYKEAEETTGIASIAMASVTEAASKIDSFRDDLFLGDVIQKTQAAIKAWAKTALVLKKDLEHLSAASKVTQEQQLKNAEYEKIACTAKALWYEARKKEALAHLEMDSIAAFVTEEGITRADEVIQEARAIETAWKKTAEALRNCRALSLGIVKSSFTTHPSCSIEIADNQAATWNASATRFNILKLETIARIAKDKAVAAGSAPEAVSLWNEVFQKASHVKDACIDAASVCRTGYELAPKQIKESWIKEIQWAENRRLLYVKRALRCKARMEVCSTNIAIEQAMTSSDAEAIDHWKRSFQKASKVAATCAELLDHSEPNLVMASEEEVIRGLQNLEKVKHQQAFWIAQREWCKAQISICKARLAIDRARTSLPLESTFQWEEALRLVQKTETALSNLLLFCHQGTKDIQQHFQTSWKASIEALQDEKDHWTVKRHSSIAQREGILARNIIDHLEVLTPEESPSYLNEAIDHVTTARDTWSRIEESCRQHQNQAPQRFQELWGQKLKEAERQKECWDAMLPWLEVKQAWAQHDLTTQKK